MAQEATQARRVNRRVAVIALLGGLWAVLKLLESSARVENRLVRCGEQLVTETTNPFQHVTVVAPTEGAVKNLLFRYEPPPQVLSDEEEEDDDEEEEGLLSLKVVQGSSTTAPEDLDVGAFVMQRVCVRRGSSVHFDVTSQDDSSSPRKATVFVFDCAKHMGAFTDPRHNFTQRRGALLRAVVGCNAPGGTLEADDALFESRTSNFIDLCVAVRNNVATSTSAGGSLVGSVLHGAQLHVRAVFARTSTEGASARCDSARCNFSASAPPGVRAGNLVVITELSRECQQPDEEGVRVDVLVWYAPWVHAAAFCGTALLAYVVLDVLLPAMFHLKHKHEDSTKSD